MTTKLENFSLVHKLAQAHLKIKMNLPKSISVILKMPTVLRSRRREVQGKGNNRQKKPCVNSFGKNKLKLWHTFSSYSLFHNF